MPGTDPTVRGARRALVPPYRTGGLLVVVGLLLGWSAGTPSVTRVDLAVILAVQSWGPPWLHQVAHGCDLLFGSWSALALVVVAGAGLARPTTRPAALTLFAAVTAGWGSVMVAKVVVARERPPGELWEGVHVGVFSFPSGHTALALAVAVTPVLLARARSDGRRPSRVGWLLVVVVVTTVAWSRVYLGVHHPTDVLGSLLVGGGALVAAAVPLRRLLAAGDPLAGGLAPDHRWEQEEDEPAADPPGRPLDEEERSARGSGP